MLTKAQLNHIDEMHIRAQAHLVALSAFRDSRYKDKALGQEERQLEAEVKTVFKAIIKEWLEANNLTAFIRSELQIRYYPRYWIQLGATSIFNGKGGLDKKSRWLNKITVTRGPNKTMRLRSHKARTDPDFLEPTASKFVLLMQHIQAALNDKSPG